MIIAGSLTNQPDILHRPLKYYVIRMEYIIVCHPGAKLAKAFLD